jgi:hypothetical protein
MKRSNVDEEDKFYSGKTSDVVRQLALLGYAIMWVLKRDTPSGPAVSTEFQLPALFLALSLLLDFVQYFSGAIGWTWYNKSLYKAKVEPEANVTPPGRVYYAAYTAFFGKIVFLILGYVWLLYRLGWSNKLFAPTQ